MEINKQGYFTHINTIFKLICEFYCRLYCIFSYCVISNLELLYCIILFSIILHSINDLSIYFTHIHIFDIFIHIVSYRTIVNASCIVYILLPTTPLHHLDPTYVTPIGLTVQSWSYSFPDSLVSPLFTPNIRGHKVTLK